MELSIKVVQIVGEHQNFAHDHQHDYKWMQLKNGHQVKGTLEICLQALATTLKDCKRLGCDCNFGE